MTATSAKTTEAAYWSVWRLSFSRFTSRNLSNHGPNSPINCARRIGLGGQLGAELRLLLLSLARAGQARPVRDAHVGARAERALPRPREHDAAPRPPFECLPETRQLR